jgi:hypothetical protein
VGLRLPFIPALALIAALAVAGCGSSGGSSENGVAAKSPTEIVAASKAAAASASAVHVSGSIISEGAPITLDLSLVEGQGGKGRVSENGLSFELIQVGGYAYISGSAEFYKHFAGSAAAQLLQGKWLKASATSGSLASIASLTNLHKLLEAALAKPGGALSKGSTTTIEGQKAISVNDTKGGGVLYVATTGQPYPIQISKTGAGGGKIVFSEWNKPITLTAPSPAVDINQLQAGH